MNSSEKTSSGSLPVHRSPSDIGGADVAAPDLSRSFEAAPDEIRTDGEHAVPGADLMAARLGVDAERLAECHLLFEMRPRTLLVTAPEGPAGPHPLVVGLHGMGMRPSKMAEWLAPLFDMPVYWGFPSGPYPLEVIRPEHRSIGYAWYLYTGDQRAFLDNLQLTGRHLDAVISQIRRTCDIVPSRQIVMGFSQGAYLAGDYVLRRTTEYEGLVVIGGRVKVEALQAVLPTASRIPVLGIYGKSDEHVDLKRCRASLETLREAGFPVEIVEHDDGHEVSPPVVKIVREWLERHV